MRDIPADGDVPGTRGLSFVRRNRILCVSCVGKSGTLSALNENVRKNGEKQDSDGNSGGGDARRLPVVQGEDFGPPGRSRRPAGLHRTAFGGRQGPPDRFGVARRRGQLPVRIEERPLHPVALHDLLQRRERARADRGRRPPDDQFGGQFRPQLYGRGERGVVAAARIQPRLCRGGRKAQRHRRSLCPQRPVGGGAQTPCQSLFGRIPAHQACAARIHRRTQGVDRGGLCAFAAPARRPLPLQRAGRRRLLPHGGRCARRALSPVALSGVAPCRDCAPRCVAEPLGDGLRSGLPRSGNRRHVRQEGAAVVARRQCRADRLLVAVAG